MPFAKIHDVTLVYNICHSASYHKSLCSLRAGRSRNMVLNHRCDADDDDNDDDDSKTDLS